MGLLPFQNWRSAGTLSHSPGIQKGLRITKKHSQYIIEEHSSLTFLFLKRKGICIHINAILPIEWPLFWVNSADFSNSWTFPKPPVDYSIFLPCGFWRFMDLCSTMQPGHHFLSYPGNKKLCSFSFTEEETSNP
jgi:hypothetical protein